MSGGDWRARGVIVHDQTNRSVAHMLVEMASDVFPIALGTIYCPPASTFEGAVVEQNAQAARGKTADLQTLISAGQTWQVKNDPHRM